MPHYADLHVHTNHSDGSDSPKKVVERAARAGLSAIAITDHDTVSGLGEAHVAGGFQKIEIFPGVEISASFAGTELHVVGLGIDHWCGPLLEKLHELQMARSSRADQIIARLNALGIALERAEVEAQANVDGVLGRMHIARALLARGVTTSVQEGFDRFIRKGRKAFVPKKAIKCAEAIDLIHEAEGVAIVAHPGLGDRLEPLLPRLLKLPFDGIEVYHVRHTAGHVTRFTQLALEHDLLISGGSDCHGRVKNEEPALGSVRVPYHHVELIKDALRKRKRR
ncbi:MAG: PHP domain-containing protein [Nitrospiraceae bacterium]|nr:PHP domain-containing protein [Nitrospiraceae bacterium]